MANSRSFEVTVTYAYILSWKACYGSILLQDVTGKSMQTECVLSGALALLSFFLRMSMVKLQQVELEDSWRVAVDVPAVLSETVVLIEIQMDVSGSMNDDAGTKLK